MFYIGRESMESYKNDKEKQYGEKKQTKTGEFELCGGRCAFEITNLFAFKIN